jgi:septal ring factor EnvC (AmiA/AmiB activator)
MNDRPPAPPTAARAEARPLDGRLRRRLSLVAVVASLLVLTVLPAGAQGPSTTDPAAKERAEREQAKTRSGEVDKELDELNASDVELKAELARLDARVAELETAAADADAEQARIEGELAEMRQRVADAEAEVQAAKDLAAERAVLAYMKPERESATQMLAADDPQTLGRMNTLIRHVALYDHSVMVDRQMAEAQLTATKGELETAQARIDELAAQADADLAEAQGMRARQDEVRAQLELRIDALLTESKELEAQEANLTSLIVQRETAATSTTTTTAAPTTTTAAPTTTQPGQPAPPTTSAPYVPPTSPPTTRPPSNASLMWPVNGPVTSPYGPRWGTFHRGIDIGVGMGVPIAAASSGTVFFSGQMDGYGNVILIDHGNGIVTLYAHQSQLIASKGQYVGRGATIGLVGSTGHSTGPHLHFEVRIGASGMAVDPMGYLG